MEKPIGIGALLNLGSGEPNRDASAPPVNPNRQRPRVTRACDNCKARKMRCTGKLPCAHCVKMDKACEYKAKYTRGAAPSIESAPQDEQAKYLAKYDWHVGKHRRPSSSHNSRSRSSSEQVSHPTEKAHQHRVVEDERSESTNRSRKLQRTEERFVTPIFSTGEQNRSNGPSSQRPGSNFETRPTYQEEEDPISGASLFDRTNKNMADRYNQQAIPTLMYGDPPLREIDTSFFVLPTPELARAMVNRYFNYVSGTTRFLHEPTIETWNTKLLSSFGSISRATDDNAQRAVVLMVWAVAHEYIFGGSERKDTDLSFHYFHAAENQLRHETGPVKLASIQARLLQCIYLLARSRVNQTSSNFATVVNLIFALGIHRKHRPTETDDLVDIECSKRTLWAAYMVDKYLTSSVGRPQMLRDEDIDQELPMIVNDEDLSSSCLMTANTSGQSTMKACVYQIKLSLLMRKILANLYSIRKPSIAQRFALASSLAQELKQWQDETMHFIDLDPAPLSETLRYQILGLRLRLQEILVLLFRPFLLDDFEHHRYQDENGYDLGQKSRENVQRCLQAALAITGIVNEMATRPCDFGASWFAHFCGYQAVLPLYVYVIKHQSSPPSTWVPYFEAASRCQEQIKVSAEKESFSQKCSGVIEELRLEAVACIKKHGNYGHLPGVRSSVIQGEGQEEGGGVRDEGGERMRGEGDGGGRGQDGRGTTSFFGGSWNDMNFDQSAPGGGILGSLFGSVDGIHIRDQSDSVVDRIDRWGFSSLTGY